MKKLWRNFEFLLAVCAAIALVHLFNIYSNYYLLKHFGLDPRSLSDVPHILTAPFLHVSYMHLFNNLAGLLIFGTLCMLRSRRFFINSSIFIILLGGTLVWMFGRGHTHVGASGWVFGLWSLMIAMAWVEKSVSSILIAMFVIIFYGGMIYGVLPSDPRVSFESHLFGALAGVLCAFLMHKKGRYSRSTS